MSRSIRWTLIVKCLLMFIVSYAIFFLNDAAQFSLFTSQVPLVGHHKSGGAENGMEFRYEYASGWPLEFLRTRETAASQQIAPDSDDDSSRPPDINEIPTVTFVDERLGNLAINAILWSLLIVAPAAIANQFESTGVWPALLRAQAIFILTFAASMVHVFVDLSAPAVTPGKLLGATLRYPFLTMDDEPGVLLVFLVVQAALAACVFCVGTIVWRVLRRLLAATVGQSSKWRRLGAIGRGKSPTNKLIRICHGLPTVAVLLFVAVSWQCTSATRHAVDELRSFGAAVSFRFANGRTDNNGLPMPLEYYLGFAKVDDVIFFELPQWHERISKSLDKINTIVRFNLAGDGVTDDAMADLVKLPNLRRLELSGANVTINGLMQLTQCPSLRMLCIIPTFGDGLPRIAASDIENLHIAMPLVDISR